MTVSDEPGPAAFYRRLTAFLEARVPFALATVVGFAGSTPREVGAKMIVTDEQTYGTIGGGALELAVVEDARTRLAAGKSRSTKRSFDLQAAPEQLQKAPDEDKNSGDGDGDGADKNGGTNAEHATELAMLCGGSVEVLIEFPTPTPELSIIGGGHIGLALARLAAICGYRITVIDDRPEFCNQDRFPDAECICLPPDEAVPVLQSRVGPGAAVVIVTHAHKNDEVFLRGALEADGEWDYLGMIGSRRKVRATFDHLHADGFTDEDLSVVRSPIGLAIGADTPEEIAVAILAEIVLLRCKRSDTDDGRPMVLHFRELTAES